MERFSETLEHEWLYNLNLSLDPEELNPQLTKWLIEYNFNRPHQSLAYLAPAEYVEKELAKIPSPVLPMWSARTRYGQEMCALLICLHADNINDKSITPVLAGRIGMKRIVFSLVIVLMLVMTACSHAANLPPEVQQAAGTWPRCNSGCTANDAVAVDAWIVANPHCTPGQNNTAEVWLTFGITREKGPFCAVAVMDIYVDDFLTYDEYNIAIGDLPGKGSWNYSIANITWPCGSVLELRDIYVQWMTNDQDCVENCGKYPPSKCWMGGPLYVRTPLVADFEFDNVCFCNNTTFTDKTTGGVKPYTWYWDFADGHNGTAQNSTHHYDSDGTYTVTLNVTDSDYNSDSQSYNVTVYANPTVEITPDGGELTCTTTFIMLTADTTGSGCSVTNYQWYKDDVALSGETGTTLNVISPGDYKVEVECANGCTDDDEVIVTQNITPPKATASSNSPVSEGATIHLYGGPNGMTSYNWTGPGGWISTLQNPIRTGATTAMAGIYTLTVTNSNGCTDDESTSVTVNAKPTATASSNSPICEGGTIQLSGGPNGMTSYSWTGPNGFSSSLQNPTILNATSLNGGTYYLTVTDGGCTSDPANTTVVVNTKPTADAGTDAGITAGGSVVIGGSPTASGGTPPYTYSWTPTTGLNDASIANPTASPAVNTTYTVTVSDSNGCTDSDDVTVTVTQGCCICGFVYRAGTMEALAGWEVILEKHTNPWVEVRSTITDANGKYCFCGLEDGEYRVSEVVQANWNQVSPLPNEHLVTLPGGASDPVLGPFLNFENEQRPAGSHTVGWEASPIDKLAVLAPWIALFALIIAGASLLVLRRHRV